MLGRVTRNHARSARFLASSDTLPSAPTSDSESVPHSKRSAREAVRGRIGSASAIFGSRVHEIRKGRKLHVPRLFLLPSWIGIVTSLAFLGLSIVLLIHESPAHLVIGQLAQYCLSTAIWWYVAFPTSMLHKVDERVFLYGDRLTAVTNICFLGWYFIENIMIEWSPLLITLAFTVAFRIFDAWAKPGHLVSMWYVFWHLNLFANNTSIICCGTVLPVYAMAGQHVLAVVLSCCRAVLHERRGHNKGN